jgi:hypothetical protein
LAIDAAGAALKISPDFQQMRPFCAFPAWRTLPQCGKTGFGRAGIRVPVRPLQVSAMCPGLDASCILRLEEAAMQQSAQAGDCTDGIRAARITCATDGRVAEWSIAAVLKTADVQASVGSNPTPSAKPHLNRTVFGSVSGLHPK